MVFANHLVFTAFKLNQFWVDDKSQKVIQSAHYATED